MEDESRRLPPEEAPEWGVLANWAWRRGTPGALGEETIRGMGPWLSPDRIFVARDAAGAAASIVLVRADLATREPYLVIAVTRPDMRRRGLASALFAAAEAAGIDVEALSGAHGISEDGAAFRAARRARGSAAG